MGSEAKRLLMAFALTFGFLFLWSKYFSPKPAPVPAPAVSSPQSSAPSVPAPTSAPTTTASTHSSKMTENSSGKTESVDTFATQTDEMKSVFSNRSGSLTSVQLTRYLKELGKNGDLVSVVPLAQETQAPLLWNLSFRNSPSEDPTLRFADDQTTYEWDQKSSQKVSFSTQISPQIKIVKSYRMSDQAYVIEHTFHIENQSSKTYYVDANTSISATHNPKSKSKGFFGMLQAPSPDTTGVAYAHDEALHWNFDDMIKGKATVTQPPVDWSGFGSQYFLLTAIPTEGVWNSLTGIVNEKEADFKMNYPQRNLGPGASLDYSVKLYAGPKQIETLESVHPTLDRSIQLGSWIGGLARLIHKLLRGIYKFIPNYGWAIIILTVMVRLAVFPLAQMQAKSMKRMTQHKPAMDALKTKHANDKETYSRELMAYMRTHRINPASGCFPILIQLPIFIALYRVLYNSIELRHAPFGLWIHDLSAHDPFFVLPILVGVTFYLQTKLNPTPMADPAQQTMMKIMPVMFSVFMIFLPSGLNLYIFVSTLWGIVQQYLVQKQIT